MEITKIYFEFKQYEMNTEVFPDVILHFAVENHSNSIKCSRILNNCIRKTEISQTRIMGL